MIRVDLSSLRETKPHEYAMRFLFGGRVRSGGSHCNTIRAPVSVDYFLHFRPSFQQGQA